MQGSARPFPLIPLLAALRLSIRKGRLPPLASRSRLSVRNSRPWPAGPALLSSLGSFPPLLPPLAAAGNRPHWPRSPLYACANSPMAFIPHCGRPLVRHRRVAYSAPLSRDGEKNDVGFAHPEQGFALHLTVAK